MAMEVLEITQEDATFGKVFVSLPNKDGSKSYFILRGADGEDARLYNNKFMAAYKYVGGKLSGVSGMADLEIFLVARCLYAANEDQTFREQGGQLLRVKEEFVRGLPSSVTKKLYAKAKEISRLDELDTPEKIEKQIAALHERLVALRPETAASLEGKIAGLQKQLDRLREESDGDDAAGTTPPSGASDPNDSTRSNSAK